MATALGALRSISPSHPPALPPASIPPPSRVAVLRRRREPGAGGGGRLRAMLQSQTLQGASANYAKEMERLSAKESLVLAFNDAGGFEALVAGKTTEMQRVDVNERIVGLERLNPTPRPTTSPYLEGRWKFEWFGGGTPGLFAAKFLFGSSPVTLANLLSLNLTIKDASSKVTATMKFLNSIETRFHITTKLSVEGPIRMKEEYDEGLLETPTISEETIPDQLKGALGQAASTLQQLPAPIKDTFSSGLKLPLGGTFQRLFLISYLDEEILIIRDTTGAPDVLTRLDGPPEPVTAEALIPEYES